MARVTTIVLCLASLLACSDDTDRPTPDKGPALEGSVPTDGNAPDLGEAGPTGKEQITVNEDLLSALEVRFLKGRCVGRASINANDADARTAVVGFTQSLVATIPLDGSKPTSDSELTALVPADNVIDDWAEDPADSTKGPWLITTNAFDWINGGGQPFEDNGFEAAAGEKYIKPGKSWELTLELVNMGSTAGAEAAFKGAKWDEGKAP